MQFSKDDLKEMTYGDEPDGFTIVQNKLTDTTRWSTHHELVFQFEGKYYMSDYSKGATEMQDEQPYENEGDMIECKEAKRIEEIVYRYIVI